MEISYTWEDTAQLERLARDGLEKAVVTAARFAGRDAIRALRVDVSREIRQRKRFKVSTVNKALALNFPRSPRTLESLAWSMTASGKPVPVAAFPHREVRNGARGGRLMLRGHRGVRVEINVGQPTIIKNAFVATLKSGHEGVFRRVGKARLPIKELFTTRITDVIQDRGFVPARFQRAGLVFGSTFSRVLPIEIEKLKQRAAREAITE